MITSEVDFSGRYVLEGYGPGFFRVSGRIHHGPLALLPDGPVSWTGLPDISPFIEAAAGFDVLLIGTGSEPSPLERALRDRIEAAGPGVEIMATPAACRTFNVLIAEERRVAAALLPV